jgi:hypothetical protein
VSGLSNAQWEVVLSHLTPGTEIPGKAGQSYPVTAADEKGLTLSRPKTGSTVRVTRAKVERSYGRLLSGASLLKQKNESQGGIDTTSAKEAGVVAALGVLLDIDYDPTERVFRLAPEPVESEG